MIERSDEQIWAHQEFGRAALGDRRRVKRLVGIAAGIATNPGGKVTKVFTDAAEREGAFRFVQNDEVDEMAIMHSAHVATARRCADQGFVYVPIDQSSVTLTDRSDAKGLGSVGTSRDKAKGLQVMSGIAVAPEGTPLGLMGQSYWARPPGKKKSAQSRRNRPPEDKETAHWLAVMGQARAAIGEAAPGTRIWFQLDRGGDAWPLLLGAGFWSLLTVRASWDRRLSTGGEEKQFLWETVERQEPLGDYLLPVIAGKNRKARMATMQLRSCRVTLDLHDHLNQKHHRLTVWAVQAREMSTPPRGEKRIEWMLLTTYPVHSVVDAQVVLFGYSQRWRIEEFHRTWKSGACCVEETQLRDYDHLVRWIPILASVAMRILRMTYLARRRPELPATCEFTQPEIDAAIVATRQKKWKRGDVPSIAQVVQWIAQEGGYIGKSSGGPPGPIVIARGLRALRVLARVFDDEQRRETEK